MRALFLLYFLLLGCNQSLTRETAQVNDQPKVPDTEYLDALESKKLMETHCYVCHGPVTSAGSGRVAPPMVAIKAHYIDEDTEREEFIDSVSSFVKNPSGEKARLRGAVRRHGLMPRLFLPDQTLSRIASFMYDYKIDQPEWFADHISHFKPNWNQTGKEFVFTDKSSSLADTGLRYALETKKLLGKNLMESLQKSGPLEALGFCNHEAIPLTRSMEEKFNAKIKRASDRNRNPDNKATQDELEQINYFKKALQEKEEITPVVVESANKINFYYPIETNSMCLQCHGKNIDADVSKRISELYPNDKAIGYGENEIRGVWSIAFER